MSSAIPSWPAPPWTASPTTPTRSSFEEPATGSEAAERRVPATPQLCHRNNCPESLQNRQPDQIKWPTSRRSWVAQCGRLLTGLRKQLAEHPFGTIKHAMDQGYFLLRGLEKVRAETPALAAQVQVWP